MSACKNCQGSGFVQDGYDGEAPCELCNVEKFIVYLREEWNRALAERNTARAEVTFMRSKYSGLRFAGLELLNNLDLLNNPAVGLADTGISKVWLEIDKSIFPLRAPVGEEGEEGDSRE